MPKATDKSFTDKLNTLWDKKSSKYRSSRLSQGFILTHYAAEVEYNTEGWLEKNKDPLNDNIIQLLVDSSESQVATLFAAEAASIGNSNKTEKLIKKGIFRTVAQRHKEQLNHLMSQLNSTHPHFVRCIIPNHEKTPHKLDNLLVLDQLRCNGVLEGIRIARTGYPNRLFFAEFRQRYEVLVSGMPKGYIEGQKACHLILSKLKLDQNLYRIGLTKVFFKSGVLAELEEKRELMVRQILTRFQSISRGAIQRQRIQKELHKSQAVSLIKKNFELYLQMKDNPWWKLYVKMSPLLLASQDTGRSKAQDMEIEKLEKNIKEAETLKQKLEEDYRKAGTELAQVKEVLEREREIALDKEEILKRVQQHESDLEEQLAGALEDLDNLEIQCEELLMAKKKVDSEIETWKGELVKGAKLIGILETEKAKLKEQLYLVEEELDASSATQQSQKTQIDSLTGELEYLRSQLEERQARIAELEDMLEKAEARMSENSQSSEKNLQEVTSKYNELKAEVEGYRKQLDEQYKIAQDYENDINVKQEACIALKKELVKSQNSVKDLNDQISHLEHQHKDTLRKIVTAENDLQSFKKKYAEMEQEKLEAQRLLQAKVSDESKHNEGRRLLDLKLDELSVKLEQKEQSFNTERQKLLGEVSAKKEHIEKLQNQVRNLSKEISDLNSVRDSNELLTKELEVTKQKAKEVATARGEIAMLKQKLNDTTDELSKLTLDNQSLNARLKEAVANSSRLNKDINDLLEEKQNLNKQISQMKKFIDDDLSNKEAVILEKNKLAKELEDSRQEISNLTFEHNKVVEELKKKNKDMRKMRTSFSDEATSQRTKLNQEKTILEASEKKLRQELETAKVQIATLTKQKEKLLQENEDLKHDVSREQKLSNASQLTKNNMEEKFQQMKANYEQQRRANSEAEVAKRKLNAALESTKKELAEKSSQLVALQRIIKPHSRSRSMNDKEWKKETEEAVDLAKKLEESEKRRKAAEESKALIEAQLYDLQNKVKAENKGLSHYSSRKALVDSKEDKFNTPTKQFSPYSSVNRLPKATNGIKSAIDSIYQSFENDASPKPIRGHFRNRSLQVDRHNKENFDDISVTESVKSLDIKNKSIEEIESLIANYESSKRDLLSVFQDTSKKLLEAKDKLAMAEQEKSKLTWELEQQSKRSTNPGLTDEELESLQAEISDLEIQLEAETSKNNELSEGLRLYKTRAEEYYSKLESAETIVLKATRAENFAKAQWKEADASLSTAIAENKRQEDLNLKLQSQVQQLQDQLEDCNIDLSHSKESQKRLAREIQDLKDRRKQEAADMETSLNTMRERYKEEIKSLSEELEREKLNTNDIQTAYRHLRHEMEMQKVKNRFDTLDPSWSSFKSQLENKVKELTKSNEDAVLAHQDAQKRIGSLLSQIRTMRSTMEEITANRDQLQDEKRVLEKRLNEVSKQVEELASQSSLGSRRDESSQNELDEQGLLKEKELEVKQALERLSTAESSLDELKAQLDKERAKMEEIRQEKLLADKENKKLHLKLVDMEAQMIGSKSHDSTKFLQSKISDLERQIEQKTRELAEQTRDFRSHDRTFKDLTNQISLKDKTVQKLTEDMARNENKIRILQETVETLQSMETTYRLSARRAERDSKDAKEKYLRLQKDYEELKNRYDAIISTRRQSRLVF